MEKFLFLISSLLLFIILLLIAINRNIISIKDERLMERNLPKAENFKEQIEEKQQIEELEDRSKNIEKKFKIINPIKKVNNLGKVLSDIESHLPNGHLYKDNDKVTWGHESTHGINSKLRSIESQIKFSKLSFYSPNTELEEVGKWIKNDHIEKVFISNQKINTFYLLNNRYIVLNEPSFKLNDIAQSIPEDLRGPVYDLYLIKQQKYWNDSPLYVLDEWVSYYNGSAVRLDLKIEDREESLYYMFEFMVYSIILANKSNDKDIIDFVAWQARRCIKLLEYSKKYQGDFNKHDSLIEKMKSNKEIMDFILKHNIHVQKAILYTDCFKLTLYD